MIVITGGAGFIGSNLVASLAASGKDELAICDVLGSGPKWRNLVRHPFSVLIQPQELFGFLEAERQEIDLVIHLGAISSTRETDADLVLRTNLVLSRDLWRWTATRGCRFIYASSAATYGDGSRGFDDDESSRALARLQPLNVYGWSKHLFDIHVANALAARRPAPSQWVGLKFFNVYGPNEYHKGAQQSMVSHAYRALASGSAVQLFKSHHPAVADGAQARDFVWIDDCVEVIRWFISHPELSGLFNVGTGTSRSFQDLVACVAAAMHCEPRIEYVEMPEPMRRSYQHLTRAPMRKLAEHGFQKRFQSLEEGVELYVRRYLATAECYR